MAALGAHWGHRCHPRVLCVLVETLLGIHVPPGDTLYPTTKLAGATGVTLRPLMFPLPPHQGP